MPIRRPGRAEGKPQPEGKVRGGQSIKAGIVANWVSIAAPTQGIAWPPPRGRSRPAFPPRGIYKVLMRLISGARKRAQLSLRPKSGHVRPTTGGLGGWEWPDVAAMRDS